MILRAFAALVLLTPALVHAQRDNPNSRSNTYTAFTEYSNDSSHIILGSTPNRKLAGAGIQYERRLLSSPYLNLAYMVEFRPFILSSDPVANVTQTVIQSNEPNFTYTYSNVVFRCVPGPFTYTGTTSTGSFEIDGNTTCSRQHTYAQGGSPIGLRLNLRPRHPLQVTLSSNGGYMFSTKPLPIPQAGSFNFTFNFGGGLEYFYAPHHSFRLEYLVQHYSNHNTAPYNPGVDSGFIRLAYAIGR